MSGALDPATPRDDPDPRDLRRATEAGVRLTALIAAGRYSRVLSGRSDDRAVILKVATETTLADPVGRARFAREGRVGLALNHPYLVKTLRRGEGWILLEDLGLPGSGARSLLEHVRVTGPFAADELERLIGTIAGALAYMHARGFVHRDVKPGNILGDGNGRWVLVDLGAVGFAVDDDLDGTELVGSPAWMAPEQLRGCAAHASADVWSLALVAAFALTGICAYEGTASEVLRRRRTETGAGRALAEQVCSTASAALGKLITSALAIDAQSRPPARAFAQLG